jgi:hypothetical protein
MTKPSSQQIGSKGEDDARKYISQLIKKFGFKPVLNRKQFAGSQFGKDLQFVWVDGEEKYTWHFEVKSQKQPLEKKDALEKIDSIKRSPHKIDCWCVIEFYNDPVNELDEAIANWNLGEYPFNIIIWSPQRYINEHIYLIDPSLYEEIYPGAPTISSELSLDDIKKMITEESRIGRRLRTSFPNDIEKKIIASRDKPWEILSNFNHILQASKYNTDFTIDDVKISSDRTTFSIKPHDGKKMTINGKFTLTGDRIKELEDFNNQLINKIKIERSEIIEQYSTIGDTKLDFFDNDGYFTFERVFPDMPKVSIVGIDRSYLGLDNLELKIRSNKDNVIVADNIDSDPAIVVGIQIDLNEKSFSIQFPPTIVDRQSKYYTVENELAYIDFFEDVVNERDLIIINADSGAVILSGKFTTSNLDVKDTLDNIEHHREMIMRIRSLRNYFKKSFSIPKNIPSSEIYKIKLFYNLITHDYVDSKPEESSIPFQAISNITLYDGQVVNDFTLIYDNYSEVILGTKLSVGSLEVTYFNTKVEITESNDEKIIKFLRIDDESKVRLKLVVD